MPERENYNVVLCILREISHKADSGLRIRRMEETRKDKSQRRFTILQFPPLVKAEWDELSEQRKIGLKKHWEKEIRNFKESINNRIEELRERGDFDE